MVGVFLVLYQSGRGEVLFGLRGEQSYAPHMWNLPSGKVADREDAVTAVLRETREELGLGLRAEELRGIGAVHARNAAGEVYVGFVFAAEHRPDRHGEPVICEPAKCLALTWSDVGAAPGPMEPFSAAAVELYRSGGRIGLLGWGGDAS